MRVLIDGLYRRFVAEHSATLLAREPAHRCSSSEVPVPVHLERRTDS
jgi:hypothetical protein